MDPENGHCLAPASDVRYFRAAKDRSKTHPALENATNRLRWILGIDQPTKPPYPATPHNDRPSRGELLCLRVAAAETPHSFVPCVAVSPEEMNQHEKHFLVVLQCIPHLPLHERNPDSKALLPLPERLTHDKIVAEKRSRVLMPWSVRRVHDASNLYFDASCPLSVRAPAGGKR